VGLDHEGLCEVRNAGRDQQREQDLGDRADGGGEHGDGIHPASAGYRRHHPAAEVVIEHVRGYTAVSSRTLAVPMQLLMIRRLTLALAVCLVLAASAGPAGASTRFTLIGHGWGHGIGMSQYGALGYAQ